VTAGRRGDYDRLERLADLGRRAGPVRRIDPQAALDDRDELAGTFALIGRSGWVACATAIATTVSPDHGRSPVASSLEHHAEREQIGAGVERTARELLGSHVARRADHLAELRDVGIAAGACDPEVRDHEPAGRRLERARCRASDRDG